VTITKILRVSLVSLLLIQFSKLSSVLARMFTTESANVAY